MFDLKLKTQEQSYSGNSIGYSSNDSPTKSSIFTNTMSHSQSQSKSSSGEKKLKQLKACQKKMSCIEELVSDRNNLFTAKNTPASSLMSSGKVFDYLFLSQRPHNYVDMNNNNIGITRHQGDQLENNSLHEPIENKNVASASSSDSIEMKDNGIEKHKYILAEIKNGESFHFDIKNKKTISIITDESYHSEVSQLAEMYQHILLNYREIENVALEYRTMANKDSCKQYSVAQVETNSSLINLPSSSSSSTLADNFSHSSTNGCKLTYRLPPMKIHYNDHNFSKKVFIGGFGTRVSVSLVTIFFSQFGQMEVNLPNSYNNHEITKGFCYLIFKDNKSVSKLIDACQVSTKGFFLNFDDKKVQVIPWNVNDTEFSALKANEFQKRRNWNNPSVIKPQQNKLTVFVGALHGTITAEALFSMFNCLFGNAIYAALDTDRHHYPVGSGRVTFTSLSSYELAVKTNLVVVQNENFTKTIQIDPYLEDSMCQTCTKSPGVYFCRNKMCFKYFCPPCWSINHKGVAQDHMPIRRTFNTMLLS